MCVLSRDDNPYSTFHQTYFTVYFQIIMARRDPEKNKVNCFKYRELLKERDLEGYRERERQRHKIRSCFINLFHQTS